MTTLEITDFQTVLPDSFSETGHVGQNPCADCEELASKGRRVMLHRNTRTGQFKLFVAPEGIVTAGWVCAVEKKPVKAKPAPEGLDIELIQPACPCPRR